MKFGDGKWIVTDGPFAETKELIADFWRWKAKLRNKAVEWLKRAPFHGGVEVEIEQLHELEDCGTSEAADRAGELEKQLRPP